MPAPTVEYIRLMGPAVLPFERREFDRELLEGEDILFNDDHYDATDDDKPDPVVEVNPEAINLDPDTGRYLWVIDERGLIIILEATLNPAAERKMVCHSNITGGKAALQGGEMWFGTDNKVYVNFRSGRYGAVTEVQQHAVLDYFRFVGYKDVVEVG